MFAWFSMKPKEQGKGCSKGFSSNQRHVAVTEKGSFLGVATLATVLMLGFPYSTGLNLNWLPTLPRYAARKRMHLPWPHACPPAT